MSAFVVDSDHIDLLVTYAAQHDVRYYPHLHGDDNARRSTSVQVSYANADEVGQMLLAENAASVAYRYDEDPVDVSGYTHRMVPLVELDPLVIIKAVHCLEYQSCEHPGWRDSAAADLLDRIKSLATAKLPGYSQARGWTWKRSAA